MATSLEIGDNFVVNAEEGNSEGQDFWVICCTNLLHTMRKAFKCKRGIEFMARDEVVVGKNYQKWVDLNSSYVLLKDSHDVYISSHLIRAIKFLMLPKSHWVSKNDPIYELP